MRTFVIEFNRRTRERRVQELPTSSAGMERRFELEAARVDEDIEIVSLTGTSLESLKRTHSRYFTGRELSAAL